MYAIVQMHQHNRAELVRWGSAFDSACDLVMFFALGVSRDLDIVVQYCVD